MAGIGILALAAASSCTTVAPDVAYVKADQARYELFEPIIRKLADSDPLNDPDLTGVNGEGLILSLATWRARIDTALRNLDR